MSNDDKRSLLSSSILFLSIYIVSKYFQLGDYVFRPTWTSITECCRTPVRIVTRELARKVHWTDISRGNTVTSSWPARTVLIQQNPRLICRSTLGLVVFISNFHYNMSTCFLQSVPLVVKGLFCKNLYSWLWRSIFLNIWNLSVTSVNWYAFALNLCHLKRAKNWWLFVVALDWSTRTQRWNLTSASIVTIIPRKVEILILTANGDIQVRVLVSVIMYSIKLSTCSKVSVKSHA